MTYREYTPPSQFAHIIDRVWTNAGTSELLSHSVLPDGAMDIIASVYPDGTAVDVIAVGAMTRPLLTDASPFDMIGIRFLPGVGGCALSTNAAELRDIRANLNEVIPNAANVGRALEQLVQTPTSRTALGAMLKQLAGSSRTVPAVVRAATSLIARSPSMTISTVSSAVGVSRQQLARLFVAHVGLTPKQFSRVCRVRAMLASQGVANNDWSATAADWGYADQSHMIADVKSVTGFTPAGWVRDRSRPPISAVPSLPA